MWVCVPAAMAIASSSSVPHVHDRLGGFAVVVLKYVPVVPVTSSARVPCHVPIRQTWASDLHEPLVVTVTVAPSSVPSATFPYVIVDWKLNDDVARATTIVQSVGVVKVMLPFTTKCMSSRSPEFTVDGIVTPWEVPEVDFPVCAVPRTVGSGMA